jgi:MFS family permease
MLSVLISLNVGIVILGNLTTTTIVPKVGARRMAALSFLIQAAGTGVAAFAPSLALVFMAQFLVGFAFGVNYPLLMGMSIQHVAEQERATAMGLHQAVYSIGMFGGPWLSGILADSIGMRPMFAVTCVGCAVLGVIGTRLLAKSGK